MKRADLSLPHKACIESKEYLGDQVIGFVVDGDGNLIIKTLQEHESSSVVKRVEFDEEGHWMNSTELCYRCRINIAMIITYDGEVCFDCVSGDTRSNIEKLEEAIRVNDERMQEVDIES